MPTPAGRQETLIEALERAARALAEVERKIETRLARDAELEQRLDELEGGRRPGRGSTRRTCSGES